MRDIILCNVNFILSSNGVRQFLKDASTETEQTEGIFEIFYRLGLGFLFVFFSFHLLPDFQGQYSGLILGLLLDYQKYRRASLNFTFAWKGSRYIPIDLDDYITIINRSGGGKWVTEPRGISRSTFQGGENTSIVANFVSTMLSPLFL